MMQAVKDSLEDADGALINSWYKGWFPGSEMKVFSSLHLKVPAIVIINKVDIVKEDGVNNAK